MSIDEGSKDRDKDELGSGVSSAPLSDEQSVAHDDQERFNLFAPTAEFAAIDTVEAPIDSLNIEHTQLPSVPCDLDTYTLSQLYAEGGTARVYRGFESHSKQPIAIKLLRRRFHGDALLSNNFRRQGIALSHQKLPNFPQVFGAGHSKWGPWWAMEWIEGESLRVLLNRGVQWEGRRLLSLLSQLCQTIKALHQQGIIHGDIKPDNIIYSRDRKSGVETLTLIDLALPLSLHFAADVKHLEKSGEESFNRSTESTESQERLNSELQIFGQPIYLAPECLRGDPADRRSDLYSLGILFFELSTGTLPFSAKLPEVILEVLHKEAPLASMRQSPWPYPATLDALISNLLSKRPADRLQSVNEVIRELDLMISGLDRYPNESTTHEYSASYMGDIRQDLTEVNQNHLEPGPVELEVIPSHDTLPISSQIISALETDEIPSISSEALPRIMKQSRGTSPAQPPVMTRATLRAHQNQGLSLAIKAFVYLLIGMIVTYLFLMSL